MDRDGAHVDTPEENYENAYEGDHEGAGRPSVDEDLSIYDPPFPLAQTILVLWHILLSSLMQLFK